MWREPLRSIAVVVLLGTAFRPAAVHAAGGRHPVRTGRDVDAAAAGRSPEGITAPTFKDGVPPRHLDPFPPSPTPLQDHR